MSRVTGLNLDVGHAAKEPDLDFEFVHFSLLRNFESGFRIVRTAKECEVVAAACLLCPGRVVNASHSNATCVARVKIYKWLAEDNKVIYLWWSTRAKRLDAFFLL